MNDRKRSLKTSLAMSFITACLMLTGCQSMALREGDLLFHVAEKNNAITEVTPGMIDHVAIVIGADSVIEAVGKGVVITPLDSLLSQPGRYVAASVRKCDRRQSVARAREYLGRAYDYLYLPDNDDIYCSELVQFAFVDRKGQRIFKPIPMSFHNDEGQITDYWKTFYARHNMEVPEGWPGTNPSEMSQRKEVKMKHKWQRR